MPSGSSFEADANLFLQALAPEARRQIRPRLHRMRVARGDVLIRAGQPPSTVYFPETAVASLFEELRSRQWVDVALVGREGVVGWPVLAGYESEPHGAVVQLAGTVLAAPAPFARDLFGEPALGAALLRYVATVTAQMSRTIVAGRDEQISRQVARWLLMLQDRAGGAKLAVTHDRLAGMLGVRRASVTDSFHVLEGEGVLRCTRGQVEVRNRAALEAVAGELYGDAEQRWRDLMRPAAQPRGVDVT